MVGGIGLVEENLPVEVVCFDEVAIDDSDMARMATMDRGDGVAWATGDPSK